MTRAGASGPKPKYVLPGTVRDAAVKRIRWVYEEFDGNVVVSSSGGKDSAVVVELAIEVARELDALPVTVFWLDQECELAATVEYQRDLFARPEVDGHWWQVPFQMSNSTNHEDEFLWVWDEDLDPSDWVRPKEPDDGPATIHREVPAEVKREADGTVTWFNLLNAVGDHHARDGAVLTGVRGEESPARRMGLTSYTSYKHITWGNKKAEHHLVFHPIYDWTYRDVWKAIHEGGWAYNTTYDTQYRYGLPPASMRVSSVQHETAIRILFYLQETEPETWERITRRLDGISTAGHLTSDFTKAPTDLPFMFGSWVAYFGHLVETIVKEEHRPAFWKQYDDLRRTVPYVDPEKVAKGLIPAVLVNDRWGMKANMLYIKLRDPAQHTDTKRGAIE